MSSFGEPDITDEPGARCVAQLQHAERRPADDVAADDAAAAIDQAQAEAANVLQMVAIDQIFELPALSIPPSHEPMLFCPIRTDAP